MGSAVLEVHHRDVVVGLDEAPPDTRVSVETNVASLGMKVKTMNVTEGPGGRGPVDGSTKVIAKPRNQALSMVARASSGRRGGPRTEHDPLEVSVPTNGYHRETRVKTVFGTFQAQGNRLFRGADPASKRAVTRA